MSARRLSGSGAKKRLKNQAGTGPAEMKMTKAQLIDEVAKLRRKVARMEKAGEKLRRRERVMEESEQMYRQVMDRSPIGISVCDPGGQCVAANDAIARMVGATREQVLGQNFHKLESWRRSGMYDAALMAQETGTPRKVETTLFSTSFGKKIYLSCHMVPLPKGGLLFMAEDQTARCVAEKRLRKKTEGLRTAVREKEILLSEVHHRVKNNLAIVSSILQMQSGYIENGDLRDIFAESQNRIRSMALVHEQLYDSNNFASIDLKRYVHSLVKMLSDSMRHPGSGISIRKHVSPGLRLSTEQLLAAGMIITEALTNSLRHAFPGGGPGDILVSVRKKEDDAVLLIKDSGTGFSPPKGETGSFGLRLINIFTRQLNGSLEITGTDGTEISVRFRTREE